MTGWHFSIPSHLNLDKTSTWMSGRFQTLPNFLPCPYKQRRQLETLQFTGRHPATDLCPATHRSQNNSHILRDQCCACCFFYHVSKCCFLSPKVLNDCTHLRALAKQLNWSKILSRPALSHHGFLYEIAYSKTFVLGAKMKLTALHFCPEGWDYVTLNNSESKNTCPHLYGMEERNVRGEI